MSISSRSRRLGATVIGGLVAAATAVVVPATPAGAAPSCSFDLADATMSIALPDDLDVVPVFTQSNGDLSFDYRLCSDGATPATVYNTDRIVVTGGTGHQEITLDIDDGPLAPGATDEPGNSDEIEVDIDLGGGTTDRVILYGSFDNERFRASDAGVNLNAGETEGVDVDVVLTGVEVLDVFASRGDDVVDATGYSKQVNVYGQAGYDTIYGGLGLALNLSRLDGGTEDDVIHGGPGIDDMNGFYGNDKLYGNDGDDVFETGANADGADTLVGGAGIDSVTYLPRTKGVAITLDRRANDGEAGEADNVGSDIENLTGSKGVDRINGNGKANTIRGLDAGDVLNGKGGDDRLEGDDGNDTLTGGPGSDAMYGGIDNDSLVAADGGTYDLADGGSGTDSCNCDGADNVRNIP